MKLCFALFLICASSQAETAPRTAPSMIIEQLVQNVFTEVSTSPENYPHFFVYGLEVEASVGIGDLAEAGTNLGVEFHFERRNQ